jgi:uncharacterized protein (TIGR02646 family)
MINVGYEKIDPTPTLPIGITPSSLKNCKWESKSKAALKFKSQIKVELRRLQIGRCCFCRRHLFDDNSVDIEHFLEKSATLLNFEIQNLALSCKTCNGNKNSIFLKICGYLSRKATKRTGIKTEVQQCVALLGQYNPMLPLANQSYRWVHPHFDTYTDHISIHKSWIFKWKTGKGRSTVIGLKLNSIGQLERRSAQERLASKSGLALIVAMLHEADNIKKAEIIKLVVENLNSN